MKSLFLSLGILMIGSSLAAAPKKSVNLSDEDQKILSEGEIPTGRWIPGGIVGSVVGFGIGHAIQGEYAEIGWVFTATEVPLYAALLTGYAMYLSRHRNAVTGDRRRPSKLSYALMLGGGIPYVGMRIWETVDVWIRPQDHNRRFRELQASGRTAQTNWTLIPVVADVDGKTGLGLGLSVQF